MTHYFGLVLFSRNKALLVPMNLVDSHTREHISMLVDNGPYYHEPFDGLPDLLAEILECWCIYVESSKEMGVSWLDAALTIDVDCSGITNKQAMEYVQQLGNVDHCIVVSPLRTQDLFHSIWFRYTSWSDRLGDVLLSVLDAESVGLSPVNDDSGMGFLTFRDPVRYGRVENSTLDLGEGIVVFDSR
jgi:hypothetical protein